MTEKSAIRRGVRQLRVLYDRVDQHYEPSKVERDVGAVVACKKGCAHCCHQLPTLFMPEALAILEAIKDDHWALQKAAQWAEGQAYLITQQRITATEWFRRGTRCMFLDGNSTCSVYESRPFACRTLMALDTADNCRPGELRDVKRPGSKFAFNAYCTQMMSTCAELGLPVGLTPMPIAIQWALIVIKEGADGLRRKLADSPFYDPIGATVYWAAIIDPEALDPSRNPGAGP